MDHMQSGGSATSLRHSLGMKRSHLGAGLHRPSISVRRESNMSRRASAVSGMMGNDPRRQSLFVSNYN